MTTVKHNPQRARSSPPEAARKAPFPCLSPGALGRVNAAAGSPDHVRRLHLLRPLDGDARPSAVAEALRALGYGVWRDDELPAHRAYAEVIEERLKAAKAVVVIWSAEAAKSQWVQSEADRARADRKLVQLSVDGARLPMPFDRIQCADLAGWTGDPDAPGWRKVVASVADLVGGDRRRRRRRRGARRPASSPSASCRSPT